MDFNLSPEQAMLRDSVRAYLADVHSFDRRRKRLAGGETGDDDWRGLAALGLTSIGLPEAAGGIGGLEEMLIVAEEMGRSLAIPPYVGSVFALALLDAFADAAWKAELHAGIADGVVRLAVACDEKRARFGSLAIESTATRDGNGRTTVSGRKLQILGGGAATHVIITARIDDGIGLFLVPMDAPGVTRDTYALLDDAMAADILFDQVEPIASEAPSDKVIDRLAFAGDHAILAACADAVGCMSVAIELTAAYMRERRQFGKALAEFQVLQHGAAEMFISAEFCRSLLYRAVAAMDGPAAARRRAVSACKAATMTTGKAVTGQAIHQHGGIGMTMEYPVGHCLRRLMVLEKLLGDSEYHLERYTQAGVSIEN